MSLSAKQKQAYIARLIFTIPEDISTMRLQSAWEEVVVSMPSLRTRIVQTEPYGFMQVVLKEKIEWISSDDMDAYHQKEEETTMLLGDRLSRHALVQDTSSGAWKLVWSVHHAVYDGWSMELIKEALYKAYQGERRVPAPTFNHFVKYLSEADRNQADMFWKRYLRGAQRTSFPLLPSTNFQPQPTSSIKHTIMLPHILQSGTTMSVLLYTAWAVLLGRYTESDDVVFGTTLSGRTVPVLGIEDMTGSTITTIPLRLRLSKEATTDEAHGVQMLSKTVAELLQEVQDMMTEVIPFQHAGLQNIQAISKDTHEACNFCNLLVIQPRQDEVGSTKSLTGEPTVNDLAAFHTYGLLLNLQLKETAVEALASFDSRVISSSQVQRLLQQLDLILQQMSTDTSVTVNGLTMISKEDEVAIERWTSKAINPVEECIHHLVEGHALQQPNAPAVCSWDGDLTYQSLDHLSTRLANHLKDLGIAPETIVPLAFEKSKWTIVAMLAVLKAGGAFALLDVAHPIDRLKLLCLKVKASIAIASWSASVRIGFIDTVVILDEQTIEKFPVSTKNPSSTAYSNNAAYVIFTSGSTGEPKGCVIEHGSYCTAASGHGPALGMHSKTRSLQFASYSFAATFMETLTTLMHGGCVCVLSEDERTNEIAQSIQKRCANWAFLTPSLLGVLDPESVSGLSDLCIGGESIQLAQIEHWADKVSLRQTYGSAETSAVVSAAKLSKASTTGDIGKAVTGKYWIVELTDHNKLAPVGTVGELIVEGKVIGRSYIDEPEKNAAAFIEKPDWRKKFGLPTQGSRFYKTGDLVKYNDDGGLKYMGRKDAQVKLRGQRIELGEIEYHVRRAITDIINLAVELIIPQDGKRENAMIALFVVIDDATDEAIELLDISSTTTARVRELRKEVQGELETLLPAFMVPSVFIPLRRLPMTVSGKVHRKRLREIGSSLSTQQLAEMQGVRQGEKRAPSTETERKLQNLWAQVLNLPVEEIGLDDSFFRLGGDSISAMRLVGLARGKGMTLTVADLFHHSRLLDIASRTDSFLASSVLSSTASPFSLLRVSNPRLFLRETISPRIATSVENIEDVLPVTDLQASFIATRQVNYLFLDLGQAVDVELLKHSCVELVRCHETLRSVFIAHQDQVYQVILRELRLQISEYETSLDIQQFSESICSEDFDKVIGLEEQLTRFMLVRDHYQQARLIIRMSHAQYDGVCLPWILDGLASAYQRLPLGQQSGFSSYIYHAASKKEESYDHWRRLLQGSSMTKITTKLNDHIPETVALNKLTVSRVVSVLRMPRNITAATLVSAAWSLVLAKVAQENDVCFGQVVAGRNAVIQDIHKMVGPCVNIVPVRVKFASNWTNMDILLTVQEQHLSLGDADSVGLTEITDRCTSWPSGTTFESIVQHQNIEENPEIRLAKSTMRVQWFSKYIPPSLLIVSSKVGNELRVTLHTNNHFLSHSTAEILLARLCGVIQTVSSNEFSPLTSVI
ncbi:MAG: NRPS [Candelaria pacifica]|nr:MAG: NRPS [Candelaria pacifica]